MASSRDSEYNARKWAIFMTMYLGYTLYVLDRKSFSFAMPAVMEHDDLDKDDLGLISSSQTLAYSISKFLGGILSDQLSPKYLFSAGLLLSGLATLSFTACHTVKMFAVLWFVCGFVQGGGWPPCAQLLRQWYSPAEFGTWWAILSTSMNLACSVGPLLAAVVITNFGWRASMQMFAVVSIATVGVCLLTMVDSPEELGFDSFAPKAKDDKGKAKMRGRGTWQDLCYSKLMWLLCAGYGVAFLVRTAALDWGQLYLIQERDQSHYMGSVFISCLEVGGIIGSIAAGFLGDKAVAMSKREDTRGTPRMTVLMGFLVLITVFLHIMIFGISEDSSEIWISLVGFCLGFSLYGPVALYGVMAIESAPSHLSGTAHAFVGLAANIGGIIAGLPFSLVATYFEWKGAFIFSEIILVIGLIITFLLRNLEYKMIPIKKKLQ